MLDLHLHVEHLISHISLNQCACLPFCRFGENLLRKLPGRPPFCPGVRENTLSSFFRACHHEADFIEFDVQVCFLLAILACSARASCTTTCPAASDPPEVALPAR